MKKRKKILIIIKGIFQAIKGILAIMFFIWMGYICIGGCNHTRQTDSNKEYIVSNGERCFKLPTGTPKDSVEMLLGAPQDISVSRMEGVVCEEDWVYSHHGFVVVFDGYGELFYITGLEN